MSQIIEQLPLAWPSLNHEDDETAAVSKNPVMLVEAARHALGRALVRPLLDPQDELKVVTPDGAIEDECTRAANGVAKSAGGAPQPSLVRRILDGL